MKLVLECPRCGTVYPGNFAHERGKFAEGNGYGPANTCTALIPNPAAPPAINGQGDREIALQVCAAELVGRAENNEAGSRRLPDGTKLEWKADSEQLLKLTPNEPGRAKGL